MSKIPETPKSFIQTLICIIWFILFSTIAILMTIGLIFYGVELTVFLAVIGVFSSVTGTIILWLLKTNGQTQNSIQFIKELMELINPPPTPIPIIRQESIEPLERVEDLFDRITQKFIDKIMDLKKTQELKSDKQTQQELKPDKAPASNR